MVVVLVVLSTLSILALSASYDTDTQFKIVRNDQFLSNAHLAAYSEINAQLDQINLNEPDENDEIILDLIEITVADPWMLENTELQGPHIKKGAFEQQVQFELLCAPNVCPAPPGYSLSKVTKVLRGRVRSQAELAVGSGSFSDQSQSFWYLLPQSSLYTFE